MSASEESTTVAISGPTGLVGTALSRHLESRGVNVLGISRRRGGAFQDTIVWDPDSGLINPGRLESVDTIVHLAGQNVAHGRWNAKRKSLIRSSRVTGTQNLVKSIAAIEQRPKTLICASAIGFYGDRGSEELIESSSPGSDFLANVCQEWEEQACAAEDLGLRVVRLRIGVVLSPNGGALKKMLGPFKMCLGGVVGSGSQFWSWIGLHDLVRIITFCIDNEEISGPVNAVSPEPVTNRDFTTGLGAVLHRPTVIPMPAVVAKLALGEMGKILLLASTRVLPQQLIQHGFEFTHPTLEECLLHQLHQ